MRIAVASAVYDGASGSAWAALFITAPARKNTSALRLRPILSIREAPVRFRCRSTVPSFLKAKILTRLRDRS
jgi:hypothetical protein